MSKMSFRVSGSRIGDSARPPVVEPVRTKQVGVRVLGTFVPRPAITTPLTADDYASAEDYK